MHYFPIFSHSYPFGEPKLRLLSQILSGIILLVVALLAPFSSAHGHEIRPTIANLNLTDTGYELDILLNLEAIMAEIGTEHADTDLSDNATRYNTLRALSSDALGAEFAAFQDQLLSSISVSDSAGNRIEHRVKEIAIPETGNLEVARDSRILLEPSLPDGMKEIVWSWPASYGDSIVRVNQKNGEVNDDDYSAFLSGGEKSAPIPLSGELTLTSKEVVLNYLNIGFTHIIPKGLDHILFVVGLFLLGAALRPLLIQITSFTLAHTLTLALATTGAINLSPSIVEPLIAASIVYVAVENIISDRLQKWRPLVVFCFGLLHGLGFAGVLSEIGIASGFFVTALIAFNVGVELGQLAVILICFLAVGFWFRHKPWYRGRITVPASIVIALIGLYWFVERVLG